MQKKKYHTNSELEWNAVKKNNKLFSHAGFTDVQERQHSDNKMRLKFTPSKKNKTSKMIYFLNM